jgi:hypothetical protein
MRILWDPLPVLQKVSMHWKSGHKIGCKRKGRVDFALFKHPAHHKSLSLVTLSASTQGIWLGHIRRFVETDSPKRNLKGRPTESFAIRKKC